MLAYIKGEVAEVVGQTLVIECNGIGYELLVPTVTADDLINRIGEKVKIYTFMSVREDGVYLYGFSSAEELDFFKMIITVSGIGPKGAIGILSFLSPDELRYAIISDDAKRISKAPGIGAKTASKLILELKDKIKLEDVIEKKLNKAESPKKAAPNTQNRNDAIEALTVLGYSASDATRAVRAAEALGVEGVEELIKAALKQM